MGVILAVTGAVVIAMAAAAAVSGVRPDPGAPAVVTGSSPDDSTSYGTAPAPEVARVHAALHDFSTWCTPTAGARARQRLQRDAALIVAFARRHPRARFPIDDETGTTVSLLLVTRQELRNCAPAAAGLADRALPASIRRGLTPLGNTPS